MIKQKLLNGLEKTLAQIEDMKQEDISIWYLGVIEYSDMVSWTGLGSDSRGTFYVPAVDCTLIRNSEGEYAVTPATSSETLNAKNIYQKRVRERNNIRLMNEEEKAEYLSFANKSVAEVKTQFEKQKRTSGWTTNSSFLEYLIKLRDSLIENPTVYYSEDNDGKRFSNPTHILPRELDEIKLSKNLFRDFIENYLIYLKVKKDIKEIDRRLDNYGLSEIVNRKKEFLYLPVPNDIIK